MSDSRSVISENGLADGRFERPHHQDGDLDVVADPIGGGSAQQVVQKTMAVRGHRDEVYGFLGRHLRELGRRIAHRQPRSSLKPALHQLLADPGQILAVLTDLFRFAELELVEMPCGPSIRYVHQQQLRPGQAGEGLHVTQHCTIRFRVLDSDQDVLIHSRLAQVLQGLTGFDRVLPDPYPMKVCQSSQAFSPAITTATGQASVSIHLGATSDPILRLSPVNMTSGKTANGSWRLRTTWL